jgi:hypothetical protein
MKYFATVNDEEFLIEIDHDDFIMVNGEPTSACSGRASTNSRSSSSASASTWTAVPSASASR